MQQLTLLTVQLAELIRIASEIDGMNDAMGIKHMIFVLICMSYHQCTALHKHTRARIEAREASAPLVFVGVMLQSKAAI